jgi:hypothetical protein
MPDQNFSAAELAALIGYLADGGPDRDARRSNRRADSASRDEIDRGARCSWAGSRGRRRRIVQFVPPRA